VKVAVAYAIVGWLLIEVSSVIAPALNLPDWAISLVVFFVILGFPLALILSWAYELTPEGVKKSRDVEATESITHVTGRKIDFAIIGTLVLALGFVVYNYVLDDGADEVPDVAVGVLPNSVAVLPFENMSVDPEEAFYASGIHEEILNQLVKLSALNVIARTSMQQYANTEKSIPEIARELNVETVMEGSVRYDSGRIRITAQLNDGVTGAHLWSETYTRDFDDIFAIESDVAMNVANALQAEFSLDEQENIEKIPTESPEAYALYLQARGSSRANAQSLLDLAIQFDPNFALAYSRKANRYAQSLVDTTGGGSQLQDTADLERIIQENAAKALELDSTLASAHVAIARADQFYWRWTEAQQAYQRAYLLSPNDSEVLSHYGWFSNWAGNYEDAVRLLQRYVELSPSNPNSHFRLGIALAYSGMLDAAIASWRRSLELRAINPQAYYLLAHVATARRNTNEALEYLQTYERLSGDNISPGGVASLAHNYALLGQHETATTYFNRLEEIAANRTIGAGNWVMAHLAVGDDDEALRWLQIAVDKVAAKEPDEAFFNLMRIKANLTSDPILDEPRFAELRSQLGSLN
jgi:TolB-like protein/Tfp pilus assembly protein PilF